MIILNLPLIKMDETYIVFLDIDGVLFDPLNFNINYHTQQVRYIDLVRHFDSVALSNLHYLIDTIENKTNKKVHIVLSSAWRMLGDFNQILKLFEQHNFSNYLIDKTPYIGDYDRDIEIHAWLEKHKNNYNIINYIILDDNDFNLSTRFGKRFIHCTKLFDGKAFENALDTMLNHKYEEKNHNDKLNKNKYFYVLTILNNLILWSIIFYLWLN